jgi:hypothetical protein
MGHLVGIIEAVVLNARVFLTRFELTTRLRPQLKKKS